MYGFKFPRIGWCYTQAQTSYPPVHNYIQHVTIAIGTVVELVCGINAGVGQVLRDRDLANLLGKEEEEKTN